MHYNNAIEVILIVILASAAVGVISMNFDEGAKKGKNEGIVYCIENLKECKTTYDYLKLQENQK